MGDIPGNILLNGYIEKDATAWKNGVIDLDGLSTDLNGDLSLTWGAGKLASYSVFPYGTVSVAFVSFYDPSFYAEVKVRTTNTVNLDLRFYDGSGAPLVSTLFSVSSLFRFLVFVS